MIRIGLVALVALGALLAVSAAIAWAGPPAATGEGGVAKSGDAAASVLRDAAGGSALGALRALGSPSRSQVLGTP